MGESREISKSMRLWRYLFREVDGSSLAVFRMCFGALLLFESINYGLFLCLDCYYRSSSILFKYQYFEWVTLLPGNGLEWVFALMGVSAFGVMLGWYYRVSIIVLMLCFTYHFLLDQALYLNHFYMVILLGGIMIFLPASRCWSVDALRKSDSSSTVPKWSLLWMAVQFEIILIYAGLVKLNYDWLNLEPLRFWMQASAIDEAAIFQLLAQDPGIALASYGVIALHLVGAPLLLFKKTRLPVFFVYCIFHMINTFVFDIGIFPWMTIAATLLLFDPDWPRQFIQWLNSKGWLLKWQHLSQTPSVKQPDSHSENIANPKVSSGVVSNATKRSHWQVAIIALMSVWLVLQALVPLRHYIYPGNVAWNEAGHQFSWRMKLRDKRGVVSFRVVDGKGRNWQVKADSYLTPKQLSRMACLPDLVWQFAQMLNRQYAGIAGGDVKVYADTLCSLNTRRPVPLINSQIDLSSIPRNHPAQLWVYSLMEPLPRPLFRW